MQILNKVIITAVIIICSLNTISANGSSMVLTLVETIAEAKSNDIDAFIVKLEIDKLTETKEDVNDKAEETNVLAGTAQTQLRSKVTKYIEPLRADMNLAIAISNEKQRLKRREADIINAYWQVYLAQLANEKAEIELRIFKNNYEAAKIKLSKGNISGYELASERYAYEQKQLSKIECSNKHKKALFSLNELLGKDLDTLITVDDSLTLKIPIDWNFNIDTVYKTALLINQEVYRVSKEAEFAAMKLQYAEEEFKTTSDEYLDVVAEKEKADYKYLNTKNNLYKAIVSDGNYISVSLNNYKLLNLKLEMEQSNMLAMEVKLSKGHVSNNDYLKSKVNVLKSKHQLYTLITELNYKYQDFKITYLEQID